MDNQEISRILYEISLYLEMNGVPFKPVAYEKAAFSIEALEEDVEEIYKREQLDGLKKIPGVGKTIARRIEEYLKTGKIQYYENFKKKMPVAMGELMAVEGIGPKAIRDLYRYLKIKNLKDLEVAAKAGKIRNVPNFGLKTEQNILEAIEFLKRSKGRFLLGMILPTISTVYARLKVLKEVEEISLAGSVRRMKETIGDVDFLVVPYPSGRISPSESAKKIMNFFVSLPGIEKIWGKGTTKASVRMKEGFDMDIRVVPKKSYGSALQYFTGSKEHNIVLRTIAMGKGLKLNEYGVFKGPKMIAGETETGVYKVLGMEWMPPEMRENQGEIELALAHKIPKIIDYNDLKGDLHCHSDWDGGVNTILEIAMAAQEMGYEYIGISDHTKFLRIERGLDEKKLIAQRKEVNKINSQFEKQKKNFRVLQGCEANILADGSVDIADDILRQLDYVIAGVHSQLKMEKTEMTERIIKAMENPNVDIISHPTGRLIKRRDEYQIDFDKILEVAKETGTILEVNSFPERLDLNDKNIRKAKEGGVKMVINTDAHEKSQMRFIELGIAQARRGWAEKEDIINTQPIGKLLNFFK